METSEESLFETLTKTNYIYVHECTVLKRNAPPDLAFKQSKTLRY